MPECRVEYTHTILTVGSQEDERKQPLVVVPYVSGVSGKFDLWVVFKSGPTLRSLLTKVNDPLPKEKLTGVVY